MKKLFAVFGLLSIFLLVATVSASTSTPVRATSEEKVEGVPVPCRIILNGGFYGDWSSDDGTKTGHLRGVYGFVKCGEREIKFFRGKWVSDSAEIKPGHLVGVYGDGEFKGIWGNGNARGYLKGEYGKTVDGDRYFRGSWKTKDGTLSGKLNGTWMPFNTQNLPKIPPFVEV